MQSLKRLQSEYKQYLQEFNTYYSMSPHENDFYKWDVILFGQNNTIYENGIIHCFLEFTNEYPYKPPKFIFITKLFHPNIYEDGNICISILNEGVDEFKNKSINERWLPSHSIHTLLVSIIAILIEPNVDSAVNIAACDLFKNNYNEYKRKNYIII